jgi:inhibitor of KinA sporulation pathway (predicted exonuclease)
MSNYNEILVVDLEATCEDYNVSPWLSEIIEVGFVILKRNEGVVYKDTVLIRPEKSEITQYCINLTTITPEMMKNEGVPRKDAINYFNKKIIKAGLKKFSNLETWVTWGVGDKNDLEKEWGKDNLPATHLDLATLWSFYAKNELARHAGLDTVLAHLHLTFEGTRHRGADDAFNTAKILKEMLKW